MGHATEQDDKFEGEYIAARLRGDIDHVARLLSERLRQMDKRAREANKRADASEAENVRLKAERDHWKANHDEMVARNAVLRDRPDLPADRLPALARIVAEKDGLREALFAAQEHLDWIGYGDAYERECAVLAGLPAKLEAALTGSAS